MYWASREKIQKPKGLEGFGILSMSRLSKALLMKNTWRIINSPQSWLLAYVKLNARQRSQQERKR